jgi:hypothetical protein
VRIGEKVFLLDAELELIVRHENARLFRRQQGPDAESLLVRIEPEFHRCRFPESLHKEHGRARDGDCSAVRATHVGSTDVEGDFTAHATSFPAVRNVSPARGACILRCRR